MVFKTITNMIKGAASSFGGFGGGAGGGGGYSETLGTYKALQQPVMRQPIDSSDTQTAKVADYEAFEQRWLARMNSFRGNK